MATPDIDSLDVSDSDPEDLFTSPSRTQKSKQKPNAKLSDSSAPPHRNGESKYDAEQAREAALRRELESVKSINGVIEGVISSLEAARGNMDTVSQTVNSSSTLLNTWIRILSQTEHNQRLILNPNWQGASQDVADIENDAIMRAQAAERKAAEEERRREEARQRAEEEERQRQATGTVRGVRGRGRGRSRGRGVGGGISGTGYVASGPSTGGRGISQTGRSGSGIGRGIGTTRGRARGVR
ncbi:DASH complex subunit Duo1-domain-containing protein [Bisporella sp. PMI_857]|nr:DASH complex subunit Duo1-domain-containing protein [Bisporella sp. PMI_857]